MLRVTMDIEAGNRAAQDRRLPGILKRAADLIQPEAAFFGPIGGERTALFLLEIGDTSRIAEITEPLFL